MGRAPIAGHCKTRLRQRLGLRGAASLQCNLLRDRIRECRGLQAELELHVAGPRNHPVFLAARRLGVRLRQQLQGDLGTRMLRAQRGRPVILIGTDCPALRAEQLGHALRAVAEGRNICIPATDGGYVLIGLSRPHAASFRCIAWGSARVLKQSRRQHRRGDLAVEEWAPLPDLDRPRDFWRERRCGRLPAFGYASF